MRNIRNKFSHIFCIYKYKIDEKCLNIRIYEIYEIYEINSRTFFYIQGKKSGFSFIGSGLTTAK